MFESKFFHEIALISEEREWSYGELDALVGAMCAQLQKRGVGAGMRVAFVGKSEWQVLVLLLALFRLGAIACPLHPRMPIAIALERLATPFFFDPQTFVLEGKCDAAMWDEKQIATLLFTSGSTATPKLACHSLGNHLESAKATLQCLPLGPGDRWLLSLPLVHVGGLATLFRCFLSGAAVLLSTIQDPRATHISLVPTQLFRLLKDNVPPRAKVALLGGAPIPPALYEQAKDKGWNVLSTYGMTEMSSQIALCGKPMSSAEVRVAEDGEIWVRGKTLFQGYWDKKSGLSLPLNEEGWFATGDLGRWSEKGLLLNLGRKDNLFISGGENIQPEEVEEALSTLPGVTEFLVVPVDDEEFGQRPVAFLDPCYTLQEIQEFLKDKLPSYKIPIQVFPFPEQEGGPKRARKSFQALAKTLLG
jgi:O-succinylbenzoic acid--CoA ligase